MSVPLIQVKAITEEVDVTPPIVHIAFKLLVNAGDIAATLTVGVSAVGVMVTGL